MNKAPRDDNRGTLPFARRDDMRRLRAKLDAVSEIRIERIYELREAISNRSFRISAEAIAEAMLAGK